MKRTTVRLPEDLLARARRKAWAEGRTLSDLIEEGLRLVVGEHPKRRPRVSKATGGLMPGIDINDSAALQEMDDLEYFERK